MRSFSSAVTGAVASALLVAVVPAVATDVVPSPLKPSCGCAEWPPGFALKGATAAELLAPASPKLNEAWSIQASPTVTTVSRQVMEPRITSVPVALIVGGALIASLGITQQVRRSRASRV